MNYTEEQFGRLPKWAQREIEGHEREVANLKAKIAELSSDHPDSNVKVGDYIHGDRGLPPNSTIDFYLGESRRKWDDMITVGFSRSKNHRVLQVNTSGHLVIRPGGGVNNIEITVEN